MKSSSPQPTDPDRFDGVYIGPPVSPSVFYRGFRRARCLSFKRTSELAAEQEQAELRESRRLLKERQRRKRTRPTIEY